LKRRAEEALATEGVARTELGDDMLMKLMRDALLLEDLREAGHPSPALSVEAITSEDTTSRASGANGRKLTRWSGEIPHVGEEAMRHG
jgi:hypothetical protein